MACRQYIAPSVGYGLACAVCGYAKGAHDELRKREEEQEQLEEEEEEEYPENTRSTVQISTTTGLGRSTYARNSSKKYDTYMDDGSVCSTDRTTTTTSDHFRSGKQTLSKSTKKTTNTGRSTTGNLRKTKTVTNSRSLDSAATRTTAAQQACMLSLAADAAKSEGDMHAAHELYEKSAEVFGALTLAKQRDESMDKDKRKTHSHKYKKSTTTRGDISARSEVSAESYRSDWTTANDTYSSRRKDTIKMNATVSKSKAKKRTADSEKRWMRLTQAKAIPTRTSNENTKTNNKEIGPMEERLLKQAYFDDTIRSVLRRLFMEYSEGAPTLSLDQLAQLLEDYRCYGPPAAYFAAMDRKRNKTWISTKDFELGIAALDPLTPHAGAWRNERAKYLFRFYAEGKEEMKHDVFIELLEDLQAVTGRYHDTSARDLAFKLNRTKQSLSETSLVTMIIKDQLQGTSMMLRFSLLDKLD